MSTATPGFEPFTTTPDKDGDHVEVHRLRLASTGAEVYSVRVRDADGDFHMAYVTLDDMREIAARVSEVDGL